MAHRKQRRIKTRRQLWYVSYIVHKRHDYCRDVQASTIKRQILRLSLYLIVVHHGVFLLNNTNDDTDKDIRAYSSSSIIGLWIRMGSYWMIRILIRSCSSSSIIRKQKWSYFYWMIKNTNTVTDLIMFFATRSKFKFKQVQYNTNTNTNSSNRRTTRSRNPLCCLYAVFSIRQHRYVHLLLFPCCSRHFLLLLQ